MHASQRRSPSRYQVDDENYQCDYEEEMNQATCDMQTKSQEPEDQEDHKNRPEHCCLPFKTDTRKDRGHAGCQCE